MMNATATAGSNTARGMLLVSLAMLTVPFMDALAKLLSVSVSVGQISASRFVFQTLFLLPVLVATLGPRGLWPAQWRWHAARGVLIAVSTLLFFAALKSMPVANAIAIFFVEPLILTLLCGLFLGEVVGRRRWAAVLVGFAGALLVIRPSFSQVGWTALLPMLSAVCFAGYIILVRAHREKEGPVAMQCFTGFFGALVMISALLAGSAAGIPLLTPSWPSAGEALMLAGVGLISAVSHLLVAYAYRHAEATVLAPFQYLEIISATAVGYFVFRDFPDAVTWAGIAIIVASGMAMFVSESRLASRGEAGAKS